MIAGYLLRWYTHHGAVVTVPDLTGKMPEELKNMEDAENFDITVIDSVYDIQKKKGSIAFQDPPAGSVVKRNRTIYLTLVAMLPDQVEMPNLTDMTLRQASAVLETFDLLLGKVEYVPDIAQNAVIHQRYKGSDIKPGTSIDKGSHIDLVCGEGLEGGAVDVPFVVGKTRDEAIQAIRQALMIPGKEIYMDGTDTLHSKVYRQSPAASSNEEFHAGQVVDLWFRSTKKVNFDQYVQDYIRENGEQNPDSVKHRE